MTYLWSLFHGLSQGCNQSVCSEPPLSLEVMASPVTLWPLEALRSWQAPTLLAPLEAPLEFLLYGLPNLASCFINIYKPRKPRT